MLTVATVNVNGVRAAVRRGMRLWLDERAPDVLCLQEVRATDADLTAALGDGWSVVHEEASARGRAGVAVATRTPPVAVRAGLAPAPADAAPGDAGDIPYAAPGDAGFDGTGRWVEADLPAGDRLLTVVSAYVHTGEAGTPRQLEKEAFLTAAAARLEALRADGRHVLLTGDLNVAHREADLKNWKGNLRKAGFLPQERAWFDRLLRDGTWVDVVRALSGEGPGPYSWWSWRGKAFDLDSGWRIDYQVASAGLAERAVKAETDRAPSYAERWSDHAPVVVRYDVPAAADELTIRSRPERLAS